MSVYPSAEEKIVSEKARIVRPILLPSINSIATRHFGVIKGLPDVSVAWRHIYLISESETVILEEKKSRHFVIIVSCL